MESSDLEPPTQVSDPAKYHDAWRSVVGAEYVLLLFLKNYAENTGQGVFSSPEDLDSVERRV